MRFLFMIAAATLWSSSACALEPGVGNTEEQAADERSRFFVHLNCSPQNVRAVLSTLKLAKSLSNDQSEVTLFIDLQAVSLAEDDSDAIGKDNQAEMESLFGKLVHSGVQILVCPHCAKQLGIEAAHLRAGARLTSKEEIRTVTDRAERVFEFQEPDKDPKNLDDDSLVEA